MPLQLKPKQAEVITALNDPVVDTIVLIGTVGTGKTDVAAHAVLSIADTFPKTYWPVIRANITTAKKTVIPSYLEMADKMGMIEGVDFTFNRADNYFRLPNGSIIPFIEADFTKDRDGKKIKGINATGNHIDEPDELEEGMFVQAMSRRGRRNEHGQPSVSILSMNPTDGHLKARYYDPWKAGTLPPNIRVIEFGIEDSWQSKQDIESLKTNPEWWVQRYLYNNWDYADESASLFKSKHWAMSLVNELDRDAKRAAGFDVAWKGVDRSARGLLYGLTIGDLAIAKDKNERVEIPDQAKWLIDDAVENEYGIDNTAVDAVGLGAGLVGDLVTEGLHPYEFMSGSPPDPAIGLPGVADVPMNFDKLRSQMIYLYARGIELGIIKHFKGCPYLNELQKEAMMHNFEITDKVLRVESKEQIKKRLGLSPDLFDAVIMALYVALRPVQPFPSSEDDDTDSSSAPITSGLIGSSF